MTAPTKGVDYHPHIEDARPYGVRAAAPVVGAVHQGAARAINWLMGRGHALVVDGPKDLRAYTYVDGVGIVECFPFDFRYWVCPNAQHGDFYVCIAMSSLNYADGSAVSITSSIAFPIGGVPQLIATAGPIAHYVFRVPVTPSSTPAEFSFRIVPTVEDAEATPGIRVHGVYVFEAPANRIVAEADGCDVWSFDGRAPIYAQDPGVARPTGSIAALPAQATRARAAYVYRGALFSWCRPGGMSIVGIPAYNEGWAGWNDMFEVRPALQTPLTLQTATPKTVTVHIYAKVSSGTGDVRFTMTNGSVATFALTNTTAAWFEQSFEVDRDVPAAWEDNGGFVARDEMYAEWKPRAYNQTVTIYSICVVDGPEG